MDFGAHDSIFSYLKQHISYFNCDKDDGHGEDHLFRVYKNALYIQQFEGGNKDVIAVSAILHDIHRWIKNDQGKYITPEESVIYAQDIIAPLSLGADEKKQICDAIRYHEYRSYENTDNNFSIETKIIQDADNLDAIGAIGIVRTFKYGFAHNIPEFVNAIPLTQQADYCDGADPSTLHHMYNKLLRIDKNLHTVTAKKLARSRLKFMTRFFDEFIKDWGTYDE